MTIDTLAISNKMKQAGFTPQQAEAQAQLFADIVDSDLSTKRDLKELEVALKRDLKDLEVALRRDLRDVEAGLTRDIKSLDLKITQVEANLKRDIKELELKIGIQMFRGGVGMTVFIVSVLGLMIRFLGHA